MRRMPKMLAAIAVVAGALLIAPAAHASVGPVVDPEIAAVMDAVPGGVLVDADHAVWPELGMQMTAADALAAQPLDGILATAPFAEAVGAAAVGTCASGKVCAYSGVNRTGSMLSWSTCGTFSISSSFTTRSIADARSTGYLQARNGTTVVATANAGASTNVYGTVTNVRCVS